MALCDHKHCKTAFCPNCGMKLTASVGATLLQRIRQTQERQFLDADKCSKRVDERFRASKVAAGYKWKAWGDWVEQKLRDEESQLTLAPVDG